MKRLLLRSNLGERGDLKEDELRGFFSDFVADMVPQKKEHPPTVWTTRRS